MSVFYDNYVRLCALNNLSESGAAKKVGLSNAAANGWKNGKMPSAITQIKLANLFGISPGELMGAPAISPQGAKKALTKTSERELDMSLIKRLVQLTPDEMEKVDAFVQGLLASRQG
jgi:transcriptional regulator with XRE-family HTH domain